MVMTRARQRINVEASMETPITPLGFERYAGGLALDDAKVRCLGNQAAHCRLIEPTIHLRPRTLNRRPLSTVEYTKLNSCGVCGATHEAVKRVDFPD